MASKNITKHQKSFSHTGARIVINQSVDDSVSRKQDDAVRPAGSSTETVQD